KKNDLATAVQEAQALPTEARAAMGDWLAQAKLLSRVEAALKKNDLATAVQEAQALPTEARAAMGDWLAQAKLRADAEAGLADLSAAPNMN
ncbi:hypothetical protein CNY89_19450, partial [Amaricoccus sp. HAR-UPW-R2A-40]